jgi:O-antigen/teichoic acid export membrane protein
MQALDLGLPNLMIQKIGAAHAQGDSKKVGEWFAAGTVILGLVSLVIIFIGTLCSFFLPSWMGLVGGEAKQLQSCFFVGTIATAVIMFNNSFVGYSRGIQNTIFMNGVVLVSAVVGLIISLILVLAGFGLWSVTFGLVSRAIVSFAGSLIFFIKFYPKQHRVHLKLRKPILMEFAVVAPATGLGGLSHAVMNNSETALVAIIIRPEVAAIFNLTRKAVDVAGSVVNTIGYASYGGFSHLLGSDQRARALAVHGEIIALQLSLSVAAAAAYVAVNASLVSVWITQNQYGGFLLTVLMAVQLIMVSRSYLINYLYRASGPVVKGSLALFVESAVRVPLMIGLLVWLGLPGIPVAAIITATISAAIVYRWTIDDLSVFAKPVHAFSPRTLLVQVLVFGVGAAVGFFIFKPSWIYVLVSGTIIAGSGAILMVRMDPFFNIHWTYISSIIKRLKTT